MFLLTSIFGPVNFKWNSLNSFLDRYGDFFSTNGEVSFTDIQMPDGSFDTSIDGIFDPDARSFKLNIGLDYNHGDKSTSVITPSMQMGIMELAGKTRILFNGKKAEVVNDEYTDDALFHTRLLLTSLGLLHGDTPLTRMLKNFG